VDVAAVGERIISASPDGAAVIDSMPSERSVQPISGTSYAAPTVAAIAALVRSVAPQLTARQVMQRIEATARRPAAGWDPLIGHGVVDVVAALDGLRPPAPAPPRPAAVPAPAAERSGTHRVAVIGAAVCAVLAVGAAAAPARSRRGQAVPHQVACPMDNSGPCGSNASTGHGA
jgi:membrane-anchored mycosin MYCP